MSFARVDHDLSLKSTKQLSAHEFVLKIRKQEYGEPESQQVSHHGEPERQQVSYHGSNISDQNFQ